MKKNDVNNNNEVKENYIMSATRIQYKDLTLDQKIFVCENNIHNIVGVLKEDKNIDELENLFAEARRILETLPKVWQDKVQSKNIVLGH